MRLMAIGFMVFALTPAVASEHHMDSHSQSGAVTESVASGEGIVNRIDAATLTVNISHGPIPALGWPPMTMDLAVSASSVLDRIQPGQEVTFKLKEDPKAGYVITEMKGQASK